MADFETVTARVKDIIIDETDIVANNAGQYVNDAIREFQERMNVDDMRAKVEIVTDVGAADPQILGVFDTVLPSFKGPRETPYIMHGDGVEEPMVFARSGDLIRNNFDTASSTDIGAPQALYKDEDANLLVFPLPDGNSLNGDGEYRINIPYWKYLPELTGSQSNFFIDRMKNAVTYKAAAMGFYDNDYQNMGDRMEVRSENQFNIVRKSIKNAFFTTSSTLSFRG